MSEPTYCAECGRDLAGGRPHAGATLHPDCVHCARRAAPPATPDTGIA